ncbi:MAG: hypothetical protein ABIE14_00585 [Patescibacteria group bacterium]
MQLLLPASIVTNEIIPLLRDFPLETIKKAAQKIKNGLGKKISGAPKNCRYYKIYLTSKTSAGRAVFLVQIINDQITPLLVRRKDDSIGKNITPKNQAFVAVINKNLKLVTKDLENGEFEVIELK